jgi:predicted protein tyrosine phosphatase
MTKTRDIIIKLKEVRKEKGLSYSDILDLMEKNGDYLAKSTLSKLFSEGSEDLSFKYEETIRPIAKALLGIETIEVDDDFRANIIQYFKECFSFIEGNDKIFIHCAAGMSRSPTIVIAYLMWKRQIFLDEAIKIVREKRPLISPNANFMNQLKIFQELLIKNDYDIDNINFKKIKVNDSNCILF